MAVTAKMVKELREMTGAGMMDCKKALVETDGNIEAAVDLLKEKGLAKAAKKAGRVAAMGLVRTAIAADGKSCSYRRSKFRNRLRCKERRVRYFRRNSGSDGSRKRCSRIWTHSWLCLMETKAPLQDVLTNKIATIGENMTIRRFEKVSGEAVVSYIHGGRIGALSCRQCRS